MFNQYQQVRDTFKQARPLLEKYLGAEQVENLAADITQRGTTQKPIVMVYGVYNAGKSTLINALMGEALAPMGDTPLTYKVEQYQIGDVEILDTPGVDAPIEHEKTSREQLAKADAVVFVLSSDGVLEERTTYEEIGHILRANKPLLVVINNKSNYAPDSPVYIEVMDKFRTNMADFFANEPEILSRLTQVNDYLINANAALKGKLENKPKLVEFSKINELESSLSQFFAKTDSAQIAKTLANQLQTQLENALLEAQKGKKSSELAELEQFVTTVREAKEIVLNRTLTQANNSKAGLKADLFEMLQHGNEADANAAVAQWQAGIETVFNEQLERQIYSLELEVQKVSASLTSYQSRLTGEEGATANENQAAAQLTDLLKQGIMLNPSLLDGAAKEGVFAALKYGKQLFPELFKGVGKVTMGRWAGAAAGALGALVNVGMAFWDYNQAEKAQQREIQQHQSRLANLKTKIDSHVESTYSQLQSGLTDLLDDIFNPHIKELQKTLTQFSQEDNSANADISQLGLIKQLTAALIGNSQ